MKKIIPFIVILFLSAPCYGQDCNQLARMSPAMMGGGVTAACSNVVATDFVGYKTAGANSEYVASGVAAAWRFQATDMTCDAGTLENAYLWTRTTAAQTAKICVYTSSDTSPQSADALVGCSGEISGDTADTWFNAAAGGTYNITKNAYYWVAIFGGASNWDFRSDGSSVTMYYASKDYASPPATMGTGWTTVASDGIPSFYFRIQ